MGFFWRKRFMFLSTVCLALQSSLFVAMASTDPGDLAILKGILERNPDLGWGSNVTDPCGQEGIWEGVFCTGSRVTQLQLKDKGLTGSLPSNFNRLTELQRLGLQGNSLTGDLPSFSGMSKLEEAFLTSNQFSAIPSDFFVDLSSLQTLNLQDNPLNASNGRWTLPDSIAQAASLVTLTLSNCSLSGPVPEVLGKLRNLQSLTLSYNYLYGGIPSSFANLTQLSTFRINNNLDSQKLSGSIDVVTSMVSLRSLWLHVNGFTGTIPEALPESLNSLQDLRLNDNDLVGFIPWGFNGSKTLQTLFVKNNHLVGPIPFIANTTAANYTFDNTFCRSVIGMACDPELAALLSFMEDLNFPSSFTASNSWDGVDPCALAGVICDANSTNVIGIVRQSTNLSGTISPALGNLTYLANLDLSNNNLTGTIPESLTKLQNLVLLDLRNNNLYGPVPNFNTSRVTLRLDGNPNINNVLPPASSPSGTPPGSSSPSTGSGSSPSNSTSGSSENSSSTTVIGVVVAAVVFILLVLVVTGCVFWRRRQSRRVTIARISIRGDAASNTDSRHSPSTTDFEADMAKITEGHDKSSMTSDGASTRRRENQVVRHVVDAAAGNLVISIEVIRNVTNDFSEGNVVGRGGFGVVYKGEMEDGTKIAVKRMIAGAVSNKAMDEFQAEIAVLTRVRHRNLVSLLGYCIHGDEKLLVYEYMPLGTLSQHLFDWERLGLEPLSWERRVSIALDVARGVEYLHGLAHQSFIHRDLKPSNILLGEGYKAKVSDFGLVKLATRSDGGGEGENRSMETRVAGTFGYLAPEYAVTGRVTTKSDVFSFGVVLMELITGRKALDQRLPEESMHLMQWFRRQIANRSTFLGSIDATLRATTLEDEAARSILAVAELAGHCTAREPQNRPDMSHAVNVLSPLVQHWEPVADLGEDDEEEEESQISLLQALAKWKASDGGSSMSSGFTTGGSTSTESSAASIPRKNVVGSFSVVHGR